MARPESVALGGYYPAPEEVLPAIASTVGVTVSDDEDLHVMDPCAGAGYAVRGLTDLWVANVVPRWGQKNCRNRVRIYACELEAKRAEQAVATLRWSRHAVDCSKVVHGDAFLLVNDPGSSVHILWHNPPYDHDRELGRLEERWLRRFGPMVTIGGALLHFVPFYALTASAETIGRHYDRVWCFRLPAPHWDAFKQVVLVGRRRHSLATPDPEVVAKVRAWGASAAAIPELPIEGLREPCFTLQTKLTVRPPKWERGTIDLAALLANYEPWTMTDRAGRRLPIPNVEPEGAYADLMAPRIRIACPPRPSHIADACGSGVLSGAMLRPDPGQEGPDLLLKGVHRRGFAHLGWKMKGDQKMAEERQHRPELQLSILDLARGEYHTLKPTVEPTQAHSPAEWSVGDLLLRYSGSMLAAMRDRCDLVFDPTRAADRELVVWPICPQPLMGAQENAVRASLRLLAEPDRSVILLGEIGVGKTRISLITAWHQLGGRGRILVVVPPVIVGEWRAEVGKALPDARVVVVSTVEDVDALAASEPDGLEVVLLSKEAAKLGHEWEGVAACPRCGAGQEETASRIAERRGTCEAVRETPGNEAARIVAMLAEHLGTVVPDAQLQSVVRRVGGRILQKAAGGAGDWLSRVWVLRSVLAPLRRLICKAAVDWETQHVYLFAWVSALQALADDELVIREAMALFRMTLTQRNAGSVSNAVLDVRKFAALALLLLPPGSPFIRSTLAEMERYEGTDYHDRVSPLLDRSTPSLVLNLDRRRRNGEKEVGIYPLAAFGAAGDEPTYGGRQRGSYEALCFAIERLCARAVWVESEPCGEPLFQAVPRPTRRVPLAGYIMKRHPRFFDFLIIDEAHVAANKDSAQSRSIQQLLSLQMRRRIPVIAMTGSVMNGYAKSLFVLLWHLSAAFRTEFDYSDHGEFERRYGFLVQVVEQVNEKKERVAFGTVSDRVTTRSRTTGSAPGVLPTAIMRYLLPKAVTVQLSDLEHELPPCVEELVLVRPTEEQRKAATRMENSILTACGRDRFKAGRNGKLFGALGNLPRYYDHATSDVGNGPDGAWTVAYPEGTDVSDNEREVDREEGKDPAVLLPAERELLSRTKVALSEGRNVVVATTRSALAARLTTLLRKLSVRVSLLDAKKVGAAKRRDWITAEREAGTRILVCNPAALPVGLNNLVGYFSRVAIFDDPNNDPTLLRQFRGRFVRIGMTTDVALWVFVYEGTLQEDANDLLQKKRVVATATDGIDASAAFEVAGVGERTAFEADLGKALYALRAGNPQD